MVFGLAKRGYRKYKRKLMNIEDIFSEIYRNNEWDGKESRSGKGSEIGSTINIRKELPILFRKFKIKSILDIPCGDFNWIKEVDLSFISYTGADIVSEIIKANSEKYSNGYRKFTKLNIITQSLPKVDLILCRDLFIHLSYKDISLAVENIKKSGSRYLLADSFSNVTKNIDILSGEHRRLNLLLSPFNFPKPVTTINDNVSESSNPQVLKKLCLWKISDL